MASLETAHKEFLQAIMSHGIMVGRVVKEVINDIMRRHGIQSDFATYMTNVIAAINKSLEPYNMQVPSSYLVFWGGIDVTQPPTLSLSLSLSTAALGPISSNPYSAKQNRSKNAFEETRILEKI